MYYIVSYNHIQAIFYLIIFSFIQYGQILQILSSSFNVLDLQKGLNRLNQDLNMYKHILLSVFVKDTIFRIYKIAEDTPLCVQGQI